MSDIPSRRSCDNPDGHSSPCDPLQERLEVESQIFQKLAQIEENQHQMKEILTSWQNAKGFVATMKTMGGVVLWVMALSAAIFAMGEAIKHWLMAR